MENKKALIAENNKYGSSSGTATTKLPKLVITKFSGKFMEWLRFWGQFKAEIDTTEVSSMTKFSYLKELVDPKECTFINLPLYGVRRNEKHSRDGIWRGTQLNQMIKEVQVVFKPDNKNQMHEGVFIVTRITIDQLSVKRWPQ